MVLPRADMGPGGPNRGTGAAPTPVAPPRSCRLSRPPVGTAPAEALDELLDQIGTVEGVERTTTSIILSHKVDRGEPV